MRLPVLRMSTSSSDVCDQCGVGTFEIEQCGAETARTCTNCGYYCSGVELKQPDRNDEGYSDSKSVSFSKKYKTRIDGPYISRSKLAMIARIRAFLEKYPKNLCLQETAENLFDKSWESVRAGKLSSYAAATLIIVLREAGQSVFMQETVDFFGASTIDVSKKILYIKKYHEVTVPMTSMEHFVVRYLNKCSAIEDVDKVKDLSLSLCSLFEKVSLVTAPKTSALLAIYHAIIALAGKVPAMNVLDFFKQTGLGSNCSAFDRSVVFLRKKLIILANRLPWASKVNRRNYHIYITAILKHQSLIFHTDVSDAVSNKNKPSAAEDNLAENEKCVEEASSVDSHVLSDQFQLEMPTSRLRDLLNPKPVIIEKPLLKPVSNSEVLMESDCPEEELRDYVRTDEEVKIYLKLKDATDN